MDRIWIPKTPQILLRRHAELFVAPPAVGASGFYVAELVHAASGAVVERYEFDNLLTDAGLNNFGLVGAVLNSRFSHCAVGTGSAAPAVSDITLANEIARTNNTGGFSDQQGMAPGLAYAWRRVTRVFTEAQANGNLTELGMLNQASDGALWTRQLFRDLNGDPTTITKTADFQLRIVYEFRIHPPEDTPGTFEFVDINGNPSTYDILYRPFGLGSTSASFSWFSGAWGQWQPTSGSCPLYSGDLTPRNATSGPSGSLGTAAGTTFPYEPNTFRLDYEAIAGPAVGNGTILTIAGYNSPGNFGGPQFQGRITPTIVKDNTQRLVILHSANWGRYEP